MVRASDLDVSNHCPRRRAPMTMFVCCSLGVVACGSGSSEYGDAPGASGGQTRWEFYAGAPAPDTLLVLVDDTQAGASLREALGEAFDDWDAQLALHRGSCAAPVDPAGWYAIDRSVVFVHPSTPGAMGYWSSTQDPALRLRTHQTFGAERARWMEAVRTGIDAQPAAPGAAFQALAALDDAASLLSGLRAPGNTAEAELTTELQTPVSFGTVVALATEDASPGDTTGYLANFRSDLLGVVVPAAQTHDISDCSDRSVPITPRYQVLNERASNRAQAWPCENPDLLDTNLFSDCTTRCLQQPIAVDAGIAQCRAVAKYPGSEPCPADFGWLDPLDAAGNRTSRVEGSGSSATRVCEIRQLEGAALTGCVQRLDCAGCEPGWCATEVAELTLQERCATGSVYPPFRFVLGAAEAHHAQVTVVCNEAPR